MFYSNKLNSINNAQNNFNFGMSPRNILEKAVPLYLLAPEHLFFITRIPFQNCIFFFVCDIESSSQSLDEASSGSFKLT